MTVKTSFTVSENDIGSDRKISVRINGVEEFVLDLVGPPGIDGRDGRDGYQPITVANLTALNTLSLTSLNDGVEAFVQTQKAKYRLLDGTWARIDYADPYWESQNNWYIDPINGNDENSGATTLLPLKTHAELEARTHYINNTITVTYLNQPPASDRVNVFLKVRANSDTLFSQPYIHYKGFRTVLVSSSFTTITTPTRSAATPEATLITDTNVPSFASYVGKIIVVTSGSANGAIAWIAKDTATNTARITPFYFHTQFSLAPTPAPGDTYTICDLMQLPTVMLNINSFIHIESCKLSGNNEFGNADVGFLGCDTNDSPNPVHLAGIWGCRIRFNNVSQINRAIYLVEASLIQPQRVLQMVEQAFCEFGRGTIVQGTGTGTALDIGRIDPGGILSLSDVAFFDFDVAIKGGGDANLNLNNGTFSIAGPSVWGANINTYAIWLEGGICVLHGDSGTPTNFPNIVAPVAIRLRNSNKSWSDIPFFDTTSGVSVLLYTR